MTRSTSFTLVLALACAASAVPAGIVHVEFFYNPGCTHCRAPLETIAQIQRQYAPAVTVHVHHVVTVEQYRELMAIEDALGLGRREPLAAYVGTNHLYGAANIAAQLETLVTNALAHGGASPWRPVPADASFTTAISTTSQPVTAPSVMPRAPRAWAVYVGTGVAALVAALAVAWYSLSQAPRG